jgi:23S rRNA (uridine2552-2'-O)-methyltransferase
LSLYNKPDYWSVKAKKEGFPARSVYKLQEMDKKFGLFAGFAKGPEQSRRFKVLDLGAAPGSWSLYALRRGGPGIFVLGVDLAPLSSHAQGACFDEERCTFLQGDLTRREIQEAVLAQGPFNLVLCDAAPGTTGNPGIDALRSLVLAEAALEYADQGLLTGGNFVVKVFQGGDTPRLLQGIRNRFKTGRSFKPGACRSTSFETYYLGLTHLPPPALEA